MSIRSPVLSVEDWSPPMTLVGYTVLTCTISWSFWGVWAVTDTGSTLAGTALFVLGGLGPFAASAILVWVGGDSVKTWLPDIFEVDVTPRYYAFALLLPVAVLVGGAGIHVAVFDGLLTPDLLPGVLEYPLFLGFVLVFGGGLEEPGWRGYLAPTLEEAYTPLTAAVVVGVVWAGWHLPLVFIPGTIQSTLPLGLYVGQLVVLSVVLSWLTGRVGGSVVPAMVLHAGGNAILNYYPVGGAAGATTRLGLGLLVATLTIAVGIVVLVAGPSLGTRG